MNKLPLLIALFGLISFSACNSKAANRKETAKLPVTNPVLMDTSFTKEYITEIESVQNIEVRAKVKGYLESIKVDEGQHVSAGQTLFVIRSREFDAELAEAKAKVRTVELEMQNVKALADKNIVSKAELALAVAKLNEAKTELGVAETNLSFTRITAPFSGIVDRLKFKVGSLVDEGTLLTSLSNNKSIYAYFNVSELEYLSYKAREKSGEKKPVTLLLANNEPHKYKGVIETIEGEFDKNTGSIPFRAEFPNPDLLLKHGETGKVQLTVDLKNALIIPQKATFELLDKVYAFVADEKNVVKAVSVSIKQKLNNLYVIDAGLSVNDKILLEGLQTVKEGDKIETEFRDPRNVMQQLQLIKE
jgi:membrane fusion protein, multidrug efflux system